MYGLPEGVIALNEDPYNIEGTVAWYCAYQNSQQAGAVLQQAFPEGARNGFDALSGTPDQRRAMVRWQFQGSEFFGDVLVDNNLRPVGFCIEVHSGIMVFNFDGHHIPCPRFPDGHPALAGLYD